MDDKVWVCIKCHTVHDGKLNACPKCGCQYSLKIK